MTDYRVLNEHTLGYLQPGATLNFGVLQGDIFAGGRDWKNGPTVTGPLDDLRPATLADFERFRVCPKGYIGDSTDRLASKPDNG